jgi:hypothetical protein
MDECNIFVNQPPLVMFDSFAVDEHRIYELVLRDFLSYRLSKLGKKEYNYLIFGCIPQKDELDIPLIMGEYVEVHFPMKLLAQSIRNARTDLDFESLKESGKRYDLYLKFSRVTQKKLDIKEMKVKEI